MVFLQDSSTAQEPFGAMVSGWQEINSYWYYFYTVETNGHPYGAMAKGWFTVNDNEYYTEIDENSSIPQGARQVGWRNFGNSTKPEWAFFNISSGICEVKGQFSKGCEHGKTTYLDYKFKASVKPLNYVYWGNTYRERIDEGVSVWNNATDVVELVEVMNSGVLYFYGSTLDNNYIAVTKFVYNGVEKNDPRNEKDDWDGGTIYFNEINEADVTAGTVAHELGHILGLDHRDTDTSSIMYTRIASTNNKIPSKVDVSNVEHLYK